MVHLSDLKCIGFCSFSPVTLRSRKEDGGGHANKQKIEFLWWIEGNGEWKVCRKELKYWSIDGEGSEERKGPQIEIKEQGPEGD